MVVLGILSILMVAIIARVFGDFWGWMAFAVVVLIFLAGWLLNKSGQSTKTLDTDQQNMDEGYAREQGIPYVQLPPRNH